MAAGGPRRGRRDNGLVAAEYAAVGDVDPRVGEHLLDVLGASGIAAYLHPAADLHPVTRTTTLPSRPTDRLFADREHLDTARSYLTQLTAESDADPGRSPTGGLPVDTGRAHGDDPDGAAHPATGSDPDIEAAFASIIARFDVTVDPTTPPWPEAEGIPPEESTPRRRRTDRQPDSGAGDPWQNGTDGPRRPGTAPGRDGTDRPDADRPDADEASADRTSADRTSADRVDADRTGADRRDGPSLLDGLDLFGADLQGPEDDEGYTPPPPPPLPRISRAAALALIAIAVGLVLFFWPDLLPVSQNVSLLLGFGGVLGGFVTLVWRLRPGDEEDDDDPDNGARV